MTITVLSGIRRVPFMFRFACLAAALTWEVYINGREWLARALDKAGVGYVRYENSLVAIDDLEVASRLCDHFAHRAWPRLLNAFAKMVNPLMGRINAAGYGGYYWVLDQAEIATDVMFKSRPALLEVWPDLVRHAALNLSSEDVLGFLGRKLHPSLAAQVVTDAKRRPQGWRVRHRMAGSWVKVYDKASVQRVETTINNPREFRCLRVKETADGRRERRWCEMRKGVGDLWRNYEVGIAANSRYLDALAAAPLKGEGVAALLAQSASAVVVFPQAIQPIRAGYESVPAAAVAWALANGITDPPTKPLRTIGRTGESRIQAVGAVAGLRSPGVPVHRSVPLPP